MAEIRGEKFDLKEKIGLDEKLIWAIWAISLFLVKIGGVTLKE